MLYTGLGFAYKNCDWNDWNDGNDFCIVCKNYFCGTSYSACGIGSCVTHFEVPLSIELMSGSKTSQV